MTKRDEPFYPGPERKDDVSRRARRLQGLDEEIAMLRLYLHGLLDEAGGELDVETEKRMLALVAALTRAVPAQARARVERAGEGVSERLEQVMRELRVMLPDGGSGAVEPTPGSLH